MATAAGFPAPPQSLFGVVPYTISVWTRKREVMQECVDVSRLHASAVTAANIALRRLGESLLSVDANQLTAVSTELETARQTLASATTAAEAEAHADEAFAATRRATEEQIAALRQEVDPLHDQETRLSTQLATKTQDTARIRARLQRIEIETRNVDSVADPTRLETLDAERIAREGELRRAMGPVEELTSELNDVRRMVGAKNNQIGALQQQIQQSDDATRRDRQRRDRSRDEASNDHDVALRTLAEAARSAGLDSLVDGTIAADAERKAQARRERQRIEETYRLAIDAYDHSAFRKGAGVLGGAAILIVAMLVAVILT